MRACAELLRQQDANPFRVDACICATQTLEALPDDARKILRDKGIDGLVALPAIGRGLAAPIAEFAQAGRLSQLDRLRGSTSPEKLIQSVPGIGPRHAAAVRSGLASLLGRGSAGRRAPDKAPPVKILLEVDREYQDEVAADSLPKIAPKRFNPESRAWLPIMHPNRQGWHFTALFSNTARAHELNRTDDWVVLYYYDDDHISGQCTIVTETQGPLHGRRVVRGCEAECRQLLLE